MLLIFFLCIKTKISKHIVSTSIHIMCSYLGKLVGAIFIHRYPASTLDNSEDFYDSIFEDYILFQKVDNVDELYIVAQYEKTDPLWITHIGYTFRNYFQ